MTDETSRSIGHCTLEEMTEWLATQQLDLLAQVDTQLRAVHRALRRVEKVRAAGRGTQALTQTAERAGKGIKSLSGEIAELDADLSTQASCCREMMATVERMQQRISETKLGASAPLEEIENAT